MIITISIDEIPKIMINTSGPVDGSSESHSYLLSNKTNTTMAASNKVKNLHTTIMWKCYRLFRFLSCEMWTDGNGAGEHNDHDNPSGG